MCMNAPKRENFALAKAKIVNGGLETAYKLTEIVGDDPCVTEYQILNTRLPHPDLMELFNQLRGIVARVFGVTAIVEHLESEKYPAMSGVEQFLQTIIEQYEVRGLSWSGSGNKTGVVITSVYKTPLGTKTAINTPRLVIGQSCFGLEEELERICDEIKEQVYQYLFEGKQAQLSLFGQE